MFLFCLLGGFCAPFLVGAKSGLWSIAISFACINFAAALTSFTLPETKGRDLDSKVDMVILPISCCVSFDSNTFQINNLYHIFRKLVDHYYRTVRFLDVI